MQKIEYFSLKIYKVLQFRKVLLSNINTLRIVNFNFYG